MNVIRNVFMTQTVQHDVYEYFNMVVCIDTFNINIDFTLTCVLQRNKDMLSYSHFSLNGI